MNQFFILVSPIIWTDTFTHGVTNNSTQISNWNAFVASLTSRNYTNVTIKGTFDTTGRTCTNPVVATALANALNTNTNYISPSTCNGDIWHNCATHGFGGEVWLNPPSSCSGGNCPTGYMIRPGIGSSGLGRRKHSNMWWVNTTDDLNF